MFIIIDSTVKGILRGKHKNKHKNSIGHKDNNLQRKTLLIFHNLNKSYFTINVNK